MLNKKEGFNQVLWSKLRYRIFYRRKTNLLLKNGQAIGFDFRNTFEVFFTLKQKDGRHILAIGGSGGSSQRQSNTLFTAIYYLLSKKMPVKCRLIRYDGDNQFQYIRSPRKILLTDGFGLNYDLGERLSKELRSACIDMYDLPEIKEIYKLRGRI